MTHSGAERRTNGPSKSLSLGVAGFQAPIVPIRKDVETPINERILSLVTTLSERVKHLESKLDGLEPRKRSATDDPTNDSPGLLISPIRPLKQARTSQSKIPQVDSDLREDELAPAEVESVSDQNSSDEAQEVEDVSKSPRSNSFPVAVSLFEFCSRNLLERAFY